MNETGLRGKNIDIRIRADTSYEIKRYREAVMAVRGGELMKDSGVRKNKGDGFRLTQYLTIKDTREEKKTHRKNNDKCN